MAVRMLHQGAAVLPSVIDHRAIIDAVRRHGSVHYPRIAVAGEVTVWRRRLRQIARLAGMRISVIRGSDYVIIESCDYQVSEDESFALTDVIEAHILGRELSFEQAAHARRRQCLQVVAPPE
jgi:hypothetical protein